MMPSNEGMRIPPALPTHHMQSYQIVAPISTHFRSATCAEADCPPYLNGWRTTVDESTDLGQAQAHYIRRESRRKFVEHRDPAGLTVFEFEAGQACFAADQHKVRIERPELFFRRGGDWRGNPTGERYQHHRPEFWVEDFAEHQQKIADRIQQG